MTSEEQNYAIARLMGRTPSCGQTPDRHEWGEDQFQEKPVPFSFRKCKRCPALHIAGERFVSIGSGDEVPDYTFSLDAMAGAEATLSPCRIKEGGDYESEPWGKYVFHLVKTAEMKGESAFHASASTRSEAFLRTLKLWVEKKD